MARKRRKHSLEFKQEAVRLVLNEGMSYVCLRRTHPYASGEPILTPLSRGRRASLGGADAASKRCGEAGAAG